MRLVDRDDIRRSLEPTHVPLCVKCGTSMWTIQIEDFADQGRRTYECASTTRRSSRVVRLTCVNAPKLAQANALDLSNLFGMTNAGDDAREARAR